MKENVLAVRVPEAADLPASEAPAPARPEVRFRALVDETFDFIWRSLRGMGVPADSVDDAAQQVFLVAAQKLDEIEPGRERAFLYGTAHGVAANARRARARRREVLDEDAVRGHVDAAPSGEALVELEERRALLDRILASMADDLREVFVLFVLEGLTAPEIAELVGVPVGTVASRLRRAREAFHVLTRRFEARGAATGGAR
jgi:RNA polymerase sigma-70 factor (ECF subfamily)